MKLDWADQQRKQKIITGAGIVSLEFRTGTSEIYKGYFGAAADSSSGHLVRRMWFSKEPGGKPIKAMYSKRGVKLNAAAVSGAEPKLSWTQGEPANPMQVPLKPNTTYYLNLQQISFGEGAEPNRLSAMLLSASTSGKA